MEIILIVVLCLFVTNAAMAFMLLRSNDRMADRILALVDVESARTAGVMRAKPAKGEPVNGEPGSNGHAAGVPPAPLWTVESGRDFPQG